MNTDPLTVRKIGRYEIIRKIATGGMAELFLARFVGPGGFEKRCALKRILPQFASDQVFTRMFLNEARVTAMFDHPNLVQIFELGQDDNGQFFIAMELVNGINLRQLMMLVAERNQKIPPELAAFMVAQALDGLAYAHDFRDPDGRPQHLVHRDISPQNILVSYDGWVKLVDFGIVKGNSISSETQAGMLKGKVAYMSPEQATGETIDGRSDLFSLGLCFYELVAQERPFQAVNEIMTLKAILEHEPPPITAYVPDIAEGLEDAIHLALEKQASDRFQNARAFQEHINHVLRDCPVPISRQTLSDFITSLTEGTTDSFDLTRVRIPRGAGFGHGVHTGGLEGSGPKRVIAPAPVPTSGNQRRLAPQTDPRNRIQVRGPTTPPGDGMPTPTPVAEGRPMDGLTSEVNAAGLSRGVNPVAVGVFIASALAGAILVLVATQGGNDPLVVPLAVKTVPVSPPPPTNVTPPPVAPPPPVVAPPPPVVAPPPPPVAESKAQPPPEKGDGPKKKKDRDEPKDEQGRARLVLESTPSGLTVKSDGKVLGKTPLNTPLKAGTHKLTLTGTKFNVSRTITVEVPKSGNVNKEVTFKRGEVRVLARPAADVFVNGISMGGTPASFPLYEGDYSLRLVTAEGVERTQPLKVSGSSDEQVIKVIF